MSDDRRTPIFEHSIVDLIDQRERWYIWRIEQLEAELAEAQQKYADLLTTSIRHSESMMGELVLAAVHGALSGPAEDNRVVGSDPRD